MVTGDAERHLEYDHGQCRHHAAQLTTTFAREAERLKEAGEDANTVLAALASALKMRALAPRP